MEFTQTSNSGSTQDCPKRVLVVQPSIEPPGGGNGVAAWIMEALKDQNDLTLLTWRPPKLDEVNRFFGTHIAQSDFRLQLGQRWVFWPSRLSPTPLSLLLNHMLLRRCRKIAPHYDVIVTANNESDLGERGGIQYVHFPKFDKERPAVDLRWYHFAPLLNPYYFIANRMTGFSFERMRRNLTLVNSDFIGRRYTAAHGTVPLTLHPPALGTFPEVPWESREEGYVLIGRISPEKHVERAIEILARVRARFPRVHLHIVGTGDDSEYTTMVRGRVAENASWVTLHEGLSREDLIDLLTRHRYGIHAMEDEHFGMAVAEMVSAGCIPIVPRGGGQVEIVGGDDRMLYATETEAVDRIERIMSETTIQDELRRSLAGRKELFTTERFVSRIRELVRDLPSYPPTSRSAAITGRAN